MRTAGHADARGTTRGSAVGKPAMPRVATRYRRTCTRPAATVGVQPAWRTIRATSSSTLSPEGPCMRELQSKNRSAHAGASPSESTRPRGSRGGRASEGARVGLHQTNTHCEPAGIAAFSEPFGADGVRRRRDPSARAPRRQRPAACRSGWVSRDALGLVAADADRVGKDLRPDGEKTGRRKLRTRYRTARVDQLGSPTGRPSRQCGGKPPTDRSARRSRSATPITRSLRERV